MPDLTAITNVVSAIIAAQDERAALIQRVSHLEAQCGGSGFLDSGIS